MENSELAFGKAERLRSKLDAAKSYERTLFVLGCMKADKNSQKIKLLDREKHILEERVSEYGQRMFSGLIGLLGYFVISYIFSMWSDYPTDTLTMSVSLVMGDGGRCTSYFRKLRSNTSDFWPKG